METQGILALLCGGDTGLDSLSCGDLFARSACGAWFSGGTVFDTKSSPILSWQADASRGADVGCFVAFFDEWQTDTVFRACCESNTDLLVFADRFFVADTVRSDFGGLDTFVIYAAKFRATDLACVEFFGVDSDTTRTTCGLCSLWEADAEGCVGALTDAFSAVAACLCWIT